MFFEFFLLSVFLISCNSFSFSLHLLYCLTCVVLIGIWVQSIDCTHIPIIHTHNGDGTFQNYCVVLLGKLPFHKIQLLGARLFKGLVGKKGAGPLTFI